MHRRQRRRRRHRRRDPRARRAARRSHRGRAAALVARLPHAREPKPIPTCTRSPPPQDRGQGDHHPAGPLRRRRHDRQLDELVPHAGRRRSPTGSASSACAASAADAMAPWFERMEARLSIAPWAVAPNANNAGAGARRCEARHRHACDPPQREGLREPRLLRHGLPDQRQAVDAGDDDSRGARSRRDAGHAGARASLRLRGRPGRVAGRRRAWTRPARRPTSRKVTRPRARRSSRRRARSERRRCCCAAARPDPHGLIGKRTFLHPTVVSRGAHARRVDGFAGAPQSIYSDHFLETQPIDGPIGFKLEAPPIHPLLTATTLPDDGAAHAG